MTFKPNVTFVVGTQYGDEGKGMVAKLMADKAEAEGAPFEWTARVGAQNAEHRFVHDSCDLCARILPSASAFRNRNGRTPIKALLGAGHCFRPEQMLLESVHLGVDTKDIYVDDLAMWLTEQHAADNRERGDKRGTTGWGIGAATAEKVARNPETKLMRDSTELKELLGDNLTKIGMRMQTDFAGKGLFEGSQGFMLSLNHGRFPWSTAKDVTISNMCSELGLSTKRIEKVIGVVRLVFMRVSGPSGPTGGQEISYDDVEKRTGLRQPNHKRMQGDSMKWTSTVGKAAGATDEERLFDFSMEELIYSHSVNGYDELAVTFCDMHRKGNYRVTKWEDLHIDTRNDILRIQETLNVPVTLVRTGQGEHDNIWTPGGVPDKNGRTWADKQGAFEVTSDEK
jgi:adenylosuccinate synthase